MWLLVGISNSSAKTRVQNALNVDLPYKPPGVSPVVLFLVGLLVFLFFVAAMGAAGA